MIDYIRDAPLYISKHRDPADHDAADRDTADRDAADHDASNRDAADRDVRKSLCTYVPKMGFREQIHKIKCEY